MVSCVDNVLDLFKFIGSDKAVEFWIETKLFQIWHPLNFENMIFIMINNECETLTIELERYYEKFNSDSVT
jgi:hypothetical protein